MHLLFHLISRLAGIVMLCLVCAAGWVVYDTHRAIESGAAASADRVTRDLQRLFWQDLLLKDRLHRSSLIPVQDWESLATMKIIAPGVCITFARGPDEPRRLCGQTEGVGSQAPDWFSTVYVSVFGPPATFMRPLSTRQPEAGTILAVADTTATVNQAWHQIGIVVGIAGAMGLGIAILSALMIGQALIPARKIIGGLRRLERGDHAHRLPRFQRAEFNHIAGAVNDLAGRLAQTTAERTELTRRLFQVQEEERRALARDLHDEFGQCLTATAALAASIEARAGDRADLAEDARAIARVTQQMMTTLRGALARLRSQDLDELGLHASLAQLVAGWNTRTAHRARFHLDVAGNLASVPGETAVSLYRIAQECLTNAARHGRSKDVHLRIAGTDEAVALSVEDDGGGEPSRLNSASGHGILGIRERIAALGGSLSIEQAARGVRVAAMIPLIAASARRTPSAGIA